MELLITPRSICQTEFLSRVCKFKKEKENRRLVSDVLKKKKLAEVVARMQWLRGECIRTVLYVPSCCCFDRVHSISVYTHIAIAFAPLSVLLFSSFKVIQRVKNSTGRCEGYTRMLQTMKNYCCLRPRGCFDSQILEDEAEHNIEHGVILLNSWSRWLFVLFSQCRKYEITQGILSFTLLEIRPRSQIQSNLP